MASRYIELHTASAFSFLQGASLPEALVDRAADLGYSTLALLDRDGVYGAPRFHKAAQAAGIRPIVGAELTIAQDDLRRSVLDTREGYGPSVSGLGVDRDQRRSVLDTRERDGASASGLPGGPQATKKSWPSAEATWLLPVLCESQEGYRNLCRLITRMKMRAPKGEGALALDELEGFTGGVVALVGRAALDSCPYGVGPLVDRLAGLFGRQPPCLGGQRPFPPG